MYKPSSAPNSKEMSLHIQQGALQASFLKGAQQVEQQQECQELQVLSLLNLAKEQ